MTFPLNSSGAFRPESPVFRMEEDFTSAEYEAGIKKLIPQILAYFYEDQKFFMTTRVGDDAVFHVTMGSIKPKRPKTITLTEIRSPMSGMMAMMHSASGNATDNDPASYSRWRFLTYLQLHKELNRLYPDGPSSVYKDALSAIEKVKKGRPVKTVEEPTAVEEFDPKKQTQLGIEAFVRDIFEPSLERRALYYSASSVGIDVRSTKPPETEQYETAESDEEIMAAVRTLAFSSVVGFNNGTREEIAVPYINHRLSEVANDISTMTDPFGDLDNLKCYQESLTRFSMCIEAVPPKATIHGAELTMNNPDINSVEYKGKFYWFCWFDFDQYDGFIFTNEPGVLYVYAAP